MLGDLTKVKDFLKLDKICIDNNVFRLHYKATFIVLVLFSLLLTLKQHIGDPIKCDVVSENNKHVSKDLVESYCWIHSTFTVPYWNKGRIGKDVIQPGVGSHSERDEIKYHKYYQWVCFALYFQAILFYIPRFMWKSWEGGRMKTVVQTLNSPVVDEETKKKEKKLLINWFLKSMHRQNQYAIHFFICELLNFVNVFGQIYFMDRFLDGEFSTYGYRVLGLTEMEPEERADPMALVFPKVTKCTFINFGPTGTLQNMEGLCVLPLNILNEKIYIFLFVWFGILSVVSGLMIMYRACVLSSPTMRMYLLFSRARLSPFKDIKTISKKCEIGDWFVLYQLSKNIDPIIFHELVGHLACRIVGRIDPHSLAPAKKESSCEEKNPDPTDFLKVSKVVRKDAKETLFETINEQPELVYC